MMNEPIPKEILSSKELKIVSEKNIYEILKKEIIVGVSLHNNSKTIKKCINSIINQDIFDLCAVVILDDSSNDNWMIYVKDELLLNNILVLRANCGSPARSRNAILDFVDKNFSSPKWVARLDADDVFSSTNSLSKMCQSGEYKNIHFILGGNRLKIEDKFISKVNFASKELSNKNVLIKILKNMALNNAYNELPSCNLILRANTGFRYPDIKSAEDHWLVSQLLFFHSDNGVIVENFSYCDYSLSGKSSIKNKQNSIHQKNRERLYQTFLLVKSLDFEKNEFLGYGMEGIVFKNKNLVKKYFYPDTIDLNQIEKINNIVNENDKFIPKVNWIKTKSSWICSYKYFPSEDCKTITIEQAKDFLLYCLNKKIVCVNIKRSNFRIYNKKLIYIDIGNSISSMNIKYFIDSAARLYCISALNYDDHEFQRRKNINYIRQEDVFNNIAGFFEFYNDLLKSYYNSNLKPFLINEKLFENKKTDKCTLMIKTCAMDYEILEQQVKHIVFNLEIPRSFFEKILLIDSRENNFLRQYQKPNLNRIVLLAEKLKKKNIIDRILISPNDKNEIIKINNKWFGLECFETHTNKNAPVFPQIWAFEQVKTQYLLQCDIDILIGKKNLSHDYLKDMLTAIKQKDTISVAFNIPFEKGFRKYDAPIGEYVPEVRCGLLDLDLIKGLLPLENEVKNEKLELSWFRALHIKQRKNNKKTLRGGNSDTFYIHPHNHWKKDINKFFEIQDLVNQVKIPNFQFQNWDLMGLPELWNYQHRNEEIIFLIKGRNTSKEKINRCFASLKMQTNQDFGIIVIDDASNDLGIKIPSILDNLNYRTTLVRNYENKGRIPNFIKAISDICTNKESLIVILDLDDALIDRDIILELKELLNKGYDLIQGGMFRPNKALKLYIPDYLDCRKKFGSNVWTHLRAFKKRLFDEIDKEKYFKIDNEWISECTDYGTMIPLVELSKKPIFIYEYWYLHENSTKRSSKIKLKKEKLIMEILNKSV
ncbi:glycosyltransferase family 2 protein [Arcobacter lacus]|uniref:Glycosyltransferase 2-like domain-containing protein n=1 Tax=Arcobacter lacus TaxID=1912876 RepID=A0ABX5JIU6_9BACT|nr:glycosyltransferase [Arcobacter lacus]PUE64854.1 hypothetical protein B0175_10640 [Arcobacter lacus]